MGKLHLFCILSCLVISCSESKREELVIPSIDIQIPGIIVPDKPTETPSTVSFTTNAPWTVELSDTKSTPAWFDVSPRSGGAGTHTLTITITEENPEYDDRIAYIYFKAGSISKSIPVTQKRKGALILTQSNYNLDANGGEIAVELKSNLEYELTIPDTTAWITQVPNTKALATYNYKFHVASNVSQANRIGKVLFKDKESNLSDTLVVTQAGNLSDTAEVNLPETSTIHDITDAVEQYLAAGFSYVRIHNEMRNEASPTKAPSLPPVITFPAAALGHPEVTLAFPGRILTSEDNSLLIDATEQFKGTLKILFSGWNETVEAFAPSADIAYLTAPDWMGPHPSSQGGATGCQLTTTIGKGMTMRKLTLRKGGLKIEGTVEKLVVIDENTDPGRIRIVSGGILGTVEKAGNYKFYWEVSNAEELKQVLSRKENNNGLLLMNDITDVDLTDDETLEIANDDYLFDGQGHSICGSSPTSMLRITGKNVTMKNTKVFNANRSSVASGVSVHTATGVVLDSVACNNSGGVGLGIFDSRVTAQRLFTAGNAQGGVRLSAAGSESASFDLAGGIIAEEYSVFAKTSEVPRIQVNVPDTWHKYEKDENTVWSAANMDSLALVEIYNKNGFWNNNVHYPIWDLTKPISTWPGITISNQRVIKLATGSVQGEVDLNKLDCLEVIFTGSPDWGGAYEKPMPMLSLNISELKKLKEFTFMGNILSGSIDCSGLTSLERVLTWSGSSFALNLNGCVNLRNLDCHSSNLKSLDLRDCVKLDTLVCDGNQLTSLNLNGIDHLKYLTCANNQLSSLDLNGLSNLEFLQCTNNQLSSLDLNGLSNLEQLLCEMNQMSSLHLNELPGLKYVHCAYNKLTSLELSSLTSLELLDCRNNNIESLDFRGLPKFITLTHLVYPPNPRSYGVRIIYADKDQIIAADPSGIDDDGTQYPIYIQ